MKNLEIYGPYGGFLKWWYPQNTPKWSFLVGKPMVVGYHHFRKPPYIPLVRVENAPRAKAGGFRSFFRGGGKQGLTDRCGCLDKWVFPKIGVPQNGWFIMEDPIKMDDLGGKPTIFGNIQIKTDGCLHVHASAVLEQKTSLSNFSSILLT